MSRLREGHLSHKKVRSLTSEMKLNPRSSTSTEFSSTREKGGARDVTVGTNERRDLKSKTVVRSATPAVRGVDCQFRHYGLGRRPFFPISPIM